MIFLPGLLTNNEMAQRSNRRSPNPHPEEVFQDCITKWEESVAHSIVARRFFPPLKAVYICANQSCPSHFSLASRRRTIHSGCAVTQDLTAWISLFCSTLGEQSSERLCLC